GPVLLFVGRIQRLKGADVAVRALADLEGYPTASLVIVGGPSGPDGERELSRLHDLVVDYDLGARVRFVPAEPHDHLATYYRAADACLVPSRSESFGLVALEAAACGTPVVAAAVGGLRSLVEHARALFGRLPAQQHDWNPVAVAVDRDPDVRRWFLRLRGEERDFTTIWLTLGQRTLHYETYFLPAPEESQREVYEYLLRRNAKLFGMRFAIGPEDAIYLVGQ